MTAPATRHDTFAPLHFQAFRQLFFGRFASFLGNAVAPIALAFAVLDLSGSVAALGLVIACRTIPQVLLMLFGGVVADRFSRSRVMVVSSALGSVTQGLAAALLLSGHAQIWQLAAIEAVNGAVGAFAFPASAGLTPQTVPGSVLQQANALLRLAINGAFIGGAVLGGLLVASVGSGWALMVDACTFGIAAFCFSRMRLVPPTPTAPGSTATTIPTPPPTPTPTDAALLAEHVPAVTGQSAPSVLADLKEGWREFSTRTWLWSVVVAFSFINAAESGSVGVLGPFVADESVGRAGWGFTLAAVSIGMVLGALVALRVRPRRTLFVGMLGIIFMVPFLLALAWHPTVPVLVLTGLVSGAGIETFGIYWDLSMQQHVPQDVLSRVYSYDALGSLIFIPIGQIAAGPLASAVGTEEALVIAAVIIVIATLATLALPSVRRLERTDAAVTN